MEMWPLLKSEFIRRREKWNSRGSVRMFWDNKIMLLNLSGKEKQSKSITCTIEEVHYFMQTSLVNTCY